MNYNDCETISFLIDMSQGTTVEIHNRKNPKLIKICSCVTSNFTILGPIAVKIPFFNFQLLFNVNTCTVLNTYDSNHNLITNGDIKNEVIDIDTNTVPNIGIINFLMTFYYD